MLLMGWPFGHVYALPKDATEYFAIYYYFKIFIYWLILLAKGKRNIKFTERQYKTVHVCHNSTINTLLRVRDSVNQSRLPSIIVWDDNIIIPISVVVVVVVLR